MLGVVMLSVGVAGCRGAIVIGKLKAEPWMAIHHPQISDTHLAETSPPPVTKAQCHKTFYGRYSQIYEC